MEPIAFGRYTLIRRIAQGGMAEIYLAVQRGPHGFEKVAVLKVILPELCSNDEFTRMFLDEARVAAHLDHNNVVRVYDFGQIEGRYYIAMEHLPGEDVASILSACRIASRKLPIEIACDIVVGAATGLHFAHDLKDAHGRPMNVVHRDVSPSNLLVTYHGTVKVLDFGIARAESNLNRTEAGTMKGKVAYASPEQAEGLPLDRRSDVFALGSVLYEVLTGKRVFKRESDLATLKAVVTDPIVPPSSLRPEIPRALEEIVMRAMSRDVNTRWQSAADLADKLSAFLVGIGYVRSERAMGEFLAGLFEADRRSAKLTISRTTDEAGRALGATPSNLKHLPSHLSPIRSHPTLPAVELPAKGAVEAGTPAPVAVGRSRAVGLVFAGVALVALGGGLGAWRMSASRSAPGPIAPVVVAPVAANPPVPVAPPDPPVAAVPVAAVPVAAVPVAAVPVAAVPPVTPAVDPPKPATAQRVSKGKLTLDSSPWAEVFLNGKKIGDTPLVDFPLPAGMHQLKLVNEQKGARATIEVEIQPGKSTVKKLKL